MHVFTLPQFLTHKEFIQIKDSVEMAANIDIKNEIDKEKLKINPRRK